MPKNRERKIMNFFKEVTLKKVKHKERVNKTHQM